MLHTGEEIVVLLRNATIVLEFVHKVVVGADRFRRLTASAQLVGFTCITNLSRQMLCIGKKQSFALAGEWNYPGRARGQLCQPKAWSISMWKSMCITY